MSKITSEILKAVAPSTPANLRDRFLPFLNEACPRYGITSELQVAAFLATAAFESQYFQKTKEGHARKGTRARQYQDKYWDTGFMGRGIFQTTHRRNYLKFGQVMKQKGLVDDANLFVDNPTLLEQPRWAVESACQYWETNNLDRYARMGTKGFFGLQGLVNKGDASKEALDYDTRLVVYERARRALPDDFKLDSVVPQLSANTPSELTSATENSNTSNGATDKPLLKLESTGDAVRRLQEKLGIKVDGDFGKETEGAVRNFQEAHGLDEDGRVGPDTWAALETVNNNVDGGAVGAPVEKADEGSSGKEEPPAPPAVEVKAATPSITSQIGSALAYIGGLGISVGTFIQGKLEQITLNHVIVIAILIGVGYAIHHYSSKRAQARTMKYIENAENPTTPNLKVV